MSCCCCTCIEQSEVAIIEEFGKFDRVAGAGCHWLTPCKSMIAGKVSLRLEQMTVPIESKSKDNVFLQATVSVQYRVLRDAVDKAFYTLENPQQQIEAYVHNAIRGRIPQYDVDQIYAMRDEISRGVKEDVDHHMSHYGYDVEMVLITDVEPARTVTDAMNQIQQNQRLKAAMIDKAEAEKIRIVKAAEADAEAKRLSGVGLAEQRKAIVQGLQSSVEQFQQGVPGMSAEDIMSLLLMNQYFDTLKDVAKHSRDTTIFLQHAGGLRAVAEQMEQGVVHMSGASKKRD